MVGADERRRHADDHVERQARRGDAGNEAHSPENCAAGRFRTPAEVASSFVLLRGLSAQLVSFECKIHLRFRTNMAALLTGATEDKHAVGCPKAARVKFTSRPRPAIAEGESPEKKRKADPPDLSGTTVGRFLLHV